MDGMIIGYGVVGKSTSWALDIPRYYDPSRKENDEFNSNYYFICVPTPTVRGIQDLSYVKDAIKRVIKKHEGYSAPIIVIRSTVFPGTTTDLEEEFGVPVLFFPEFLTESSAIYDTVNPEIFMIGGNDITIRHQLALDLAVEIGKPIREVKPETAELVKYAMNTFFGTKVVLGNIFRDIAEDVGADYWEVKKALEKHKWGSKNGWNPFYGNKRGFGGKCLPKDIEAISILDHSGLLKKLLQVNNEYTKI